MSKPQKEISKPIIPKKTIIVSYVVINIPSLPMYSGNPVNVLGGCHPCRGFHVANANII